MELLKKDWDGVFSAPSPSRDNLVTNFLKLLGMTGVQAYEYEKLAQSLGGPGGPVSRGQQQPSSLGYYRRLSEEERTEFHAYVDQTFNEVRDKYPEAYHEYLDALSVDHSVFFKQ